MIIEGNTHNPYGFARRFGAPSKLAPVAFRDSDGRLRGIGLGRIAGLGAGPCFTGPLTASQADALNSGMDCNTLQSLLDAGANDSQLDDIVAGAATPEVILNNLETSGTPMNPSTPAPSWLTEALSYVSAPFESLDSVTNPSPSAVAFSPNAPTAQCAVTPDPIDWITGTQKCPADLSPCSQSAFQSFEGDYYTCPASSIPASGFDAGELLLYGALAIGGVLLLNKVL